MKSNFKILKKTKIIFTFVLILAAAGCFTACSQWETPYDTLDGDGYTVSVRFDPNGGMFAGTNDVCVVDVFSIEDIKKNSGEIELISPDDEIRDRAFDITKNGYFFAGWYTERSLRTNSNGEPLDEYGVLVSESGREQGYVYSGKWDFENDTLSVDLTKEYSSSDNVLTLYAAWVPYFNYEFYEIKADGGAELIGEAVNAKELTLPSWNEKNGKLKYEKFPEIDGKTLDVNNIYLDEEYTVKAQDIIAGAYDEESACVSGETVKIYVKYLEGTWFRIYDAKQLTQNARLDGCYDILADLDFEKAAWAPIFSSGKGEFKGKINGNGHKISNVSITQGDITQQFGGLFASLASEAEISNVTFENIIYNFEIGSRISGSMFGLLAGKISDEATLDGVSVTGKINIGDIYKSIIPTVGLLFGYSGELGNRGIDISGIDCVSSAEDSSFVIDIDRESGVVTLSPKQ